MNEKTFNRIFNVFILAGTASAVITATIIKTLAGDATFDWPLVLSAFGSIMGVLSTVSAANGRLATFIFGLIDVTLYGVMCWFGENYGNAALHLLYFVPMQVVGFVQWKKRGASSSSELRARRLSSGRRLLAAGVLVAGTAVAYMVLDHLSDSPAVNVIKWAVMADAAAVLCNIIGQFLMSTAYAEQWFFWIGVNISSVIMWSVAAADPSSSGHGFATIYIIKYAFYLLNSLNGLRIWRKLARQ